MKKDEQMWHTVQLAEGYKVMLSQMGTMRITYGRGYIHELSLAKGQARLLFKFLKKHSELLKEI